ncbi:MAG: hypothetical protein ACOCXT_05880 [Candidatus Dojkabacteria bacterium]
MTTIKNWHGKEGRTGVPVGKEELVPDTNKETTIKKHRVQGKSLPKSPKA